MEDFLLETPFIAFDFETDLMGAENLSPEDICYSVAGHVHLLGLDGDTVLSESDDLYYPTLIKLFDANNDFIVVAQNLKYDLHVLIQHHPEFLLIAFKMATDGRFYCTQMAEKLLNLTTMGFIENGFDEYDNKHSFRYSLDVLAKKYLGVDMTEEKKGEDAWRLRYAELKGLKACDYPIAAYDYSLNDTVYLAEIYEMQQERREHIWTSMGFDPFKVLCFRVYADFCFYFMSKNGIATNVEEINKIEAMLEEELKPEKIHLLYQEDFEFRGKPISFVTPAQPEQPQMRGDTMVISHVEGCPRKKCKTTNKWLCDCPPKLKKSQPEKNNAAFIKQYVIDLYEKGIVGALEITKTGKDNEAFMDKWKAAADRKEEAALMREYGFVSTNKDWLDDWAFKCPYLQQFQHRASLQKILTTELPRMMIDREKKIPAKFIHCGFDLLKCTGRTSSFASDLYPSANGQNVYSKVRQCYKPRDSHWMLSVDYSGLEFVSAAQRALDLIGSSQYAELINTGKDSHSWLACQRAFLSDDDFQQFAIENYGAAGISTPQMTYDAFMHFKTNKREIEVRGEKKDFFKYYRTSAKPIGLGILGGMGPATIASTSYNTYKIEMTEEEAVEYREIWFALFPSEAALIDYLKKKCKDHQYSRKVGKQTFSKYVYTTSMGMRRPNCSYAAGLNGLTLQSTSAEGAILAACLIIEETYTDTDSILYGNFIPTVFIHDEIFGDVVADLDIATAVAKRIEEIMCGALKYVCPDINPAADSALQANYWTKAADEVRDSKGRLLPWDLVNNHFQSWKEVGKTWEECVGAISNHLEAYCA